MYKEIKQKYFCRWDNNIACFNHAMFHYNQEIFNKIHNIDITKNNCVYLFHAMMPHKPFYFGNEFKEDMNLSREENYVKFREFTDKKVIKMFESTKLINSKNRIIVFSDHGYKTEGEYDRKYTISAFYGFDSLDVKQVKKIQDIGKLVYHSF